MGKITAAEVNQLRKMTGSGMMDCKKALVEAEGDVDKAVEILRKKGQKVAAKRGDRDASEGLVVAKSTDGGKKAVILVLNCETDFVAKNDNFNALANEMLDIAIASKASTVEDLKAQNFGDAGITIAEKITEQIGVIGEKLDISGLGVVEGESVFAYNHPGNQVASIVGMSQGGEAAEGAAKNVALQVASMAPVALNKEAVNEDIIQKEMEIGKEQARNEGKPEAILEKIAMGKVQKFLKDNTLLNQPFFMNNKQSVEQYLKEVDKELTVTDFKRFAMK